MRFNKYIRNYGYYSRFDLKFTDKEFINVKDIITKECSQFLKLKTVYFRGSSKDVSFYGKFIPRVDRKPKDTGKYAHDLLDELFYDKFGWKVRSEGVFATPSVGDAESYGEPYIFFPVNNYKYVWSPKILDLYGTLEGDDMIIDDAFDQALEHLDPKSKKDYNEVFDKIERKYTEEYKIIIDKKYTNKYLEANVLSEVSFKCKAYYLINYKFKEFIEEEIFRKGMK